MGTEVLSAIRNELAKYGGVTPEEVPSELVQAIARAVGRVVFKTLNGQSHG